MTTEGVVSATSTQAASLVSSRGEASTSSATLTVSLPSQGGGGGLPTSASVVALNSGFQGAVNPSRQRFYVELNEDEINVVSWKKLVKNMQTTALSVASETPAGANPALEARIAPEPAELTPTNVAAAPVPLPASKNVLNSVIERLERLYKGMDSDGEDDGYASEQGSHYDSDDSFIDDTELHEYLSLKSETAKTKYTGFYVNKGKLERVKESPPPPPPVHVQRKRERIFPKLSTEIVAGDFAKKRVKIGHRLKDSGKVEEGTDSRNQILNMLAERSDDEEDVRFSRPKAGREDRGAVDVPLSNDRLATIVLESIRAERNNATKLVGDSTGEETAADASSETGGFTALSKIRNNPKVLGDDEMKESERTAKTLSTGVKHSPGNKEVSHQKVTCSSARRTVLARAIYDLEKRVTEAFPLTGDRQEAIEKAESEGKSKRLPREVEEKLAKVARLAAKKGKLSDELIERLMHIIGHVMPLKPLKRTLKSMVETGLNAKQAKDARLQDMKREIKELVKSRVAMFLPQLDSEQLEGYSDDVQATPGAIEGAHNGRFKWDKVTEDRICDLYDNYAEGVDEPKGPQLFRKLYIEYLADLWPEGWMNTHGIKNAVTRAKERRKSKLEKLQMGERMRRKIATLVTDKLRASTEATGGVLQA